MPVDRSVLIDYSDNERWCDARHVAEKFSARWHLQNSSNILVLLKENRLYGKRKVYKLYRVAFLSIEMSTMIGLYFHWWLFVYSSGGYQDFLVWLWCLDSRSGLIGKVWIFISLKTILRDGNNRIYYIFKCK